MFRGQKFEVDLGSDEDDGSKAGSALPGAFVADVLERNVSAPLPPKPPMLKNASGFPEHRKRSTESRFSRRAAGKSNATESWSTDTSGTQDDVAFTPPAAQDVSSGKAKNWEEEEKQRIGRENDQKLAQMSSREIEEERKELMDSLSPALLQRLLQRSNIDSGSEEADLSATCSTNDDMNNAIKPSRQKSVSFAEPAVDDHDDDKISGLSPAQLEEEFEDGSDSKLEASLDDDTVHFPRPRQPPDLDPDSETFLEDLHQKYFPSLPSDPDKLEWMQTSKSTKSAYEPTAAGMKPKDLRFDFKGELIPPKTASEIPVSAGLHHHGDAPEAAGYTITELVHLGHSTFAPQRCVAFQTLGRLLYRLAKGEYGDSGEPEADAADPEATYGELARGLWHEVTREKVVEMLVMESEGKGIDGGKHVSARAYATEAVWLWQKSGGRRWKAG